MDEDLVYDVNDLADSMEEVEFNLDFGDDVDLNKTLEELER